MSKEYSDNYLISQSSSSDSNDNRFNFDSDDEVPSLSDRDSENNNENNSYTSLETFHTSPAPIIYERNRFFSSYYTSGSDTDEESASYLTQEENGSESDWEARSPVGSDQDQAEERESTYSSDGDNDFISDMQELMKQLELQLAQDSSDTDEDICLLTDTDLLTSSSHFGPGR